MKNNGFTLVELSIVLVIISLIVGSVLAGQSLIRSAQLGRQVAQIKEFEYAFNTFYLKYEAIPGDMRNATTIFSDAFTQNGDGDRIIDEDGSMEGVRAWQHLSLAGVIKEDYPGSATSAGLPPSTSQAGFTVPQSIIQSGGALYFRSRPLGLLHAGIDVPFIEWGRCPNGAAYHCHNGVITPFEAQTIDRKMDDGHATKGKVMSFNAMDYGGTDCSGGWNVARGSVDYNLSNEEESCRMNFYIY